MMLEIKKRANATTIEVGGRLDTITAPALEKIIDENIPGIQSLVLDLKKLEHISGAGLHVLLGAQKKMQGAGTMKLIGVGSDVMEAFKTTGFADILAGEQASRGIGE